jgi:AhpD family alkylhydroperoxidase
LDLSTKARAVSQSRVEWKKKVNINMNDWNDHRRAGVQGFAKLSPDAMNGYITLCDAGAKSGHLDAKTRELIALAVAVSLRCDGCIPVHADAVRKLGATQEELAEALSVAVSISAGAAVVYSTRAFDAFQAPREA